MKILTRWNDKVTYFVLLGAIVLSFVLSVALWIWGLSDYNTFWGKAVLCNNKQDFNCLLLAVADGQNSFNHIKTIITLNLSTISMFLTAVCITIYKFRLEKK